MEETKVNEQDQEKVEQPEETKEEKDTSKTQKKAHKTTNKKEDTNAQSDELKALQGEIESLKTQLSEKDNSIAELQTKVSEFETKSAEQLAAIQKKDVELKLAQKGLSEFNEFFSNVQPDKLDEQIEKFQSLMKQTEISNSFKPTSHKQDDAYAVAQSKGDVKSMLAQKFSGLFK